MAATRASKALLAARCLSAAGSPAGQQAERGGSGAAAALASLLRSSGPAGGAGSPAYRIHSLAHLLPLPPPSGLRGYGADAAAEGAAPPDVGAAAVACWQCAVPLLGPGYQFVCDACDAIQPAAEDPDYFEMFGL